METFNLGDGLIVTIVAMIVVFAVLATLWFLVELVHKLVGEPAQAAIAPIHHEDDLQPVLQEPGVDEQRAKVAAIMALVAAYEAHPAKKFEIIDVTRIK
ncbi:OadG family protein [Trichococcus alkaliphilus]|uniref:OadG family protein n=1 Tax=Trichococcus alkaliphilus TaxID=2052943 RepID=UPI000D0B9C32|nr:OadG family protein [Trichococcus alkaliphilus]